MKAYKFIAFKCIYVVMYLFFASIYNSNFYNDYFNHKTSLFGYAAAIFGHFRSHGVLRKNHYWIYQIIKHIVYKLISLNFTFKLPPKIMNLATIQKFLVTNRSESILRRLKKFHHASFSSPNRGLFR